MLASSAQAATSDLSQVANVGTEDFGTITGGAGTTTTTFGGDGTITQDGKVLHGESDGKTIGPFFSATKNGKVLQPCPSGTRIGGECWDGKSDPSKAGSAHSISYCSGPGCRSSASATGPTALVSVVVAAALCMTLVIK
jgi:hypothetical protein